MARVRVDARVRVTWRAAGGRVGAGAVAELLAGVAADGLPLGIRHAVVTADSALVLGGLRAPIVRAVLLSLLTCGRGTRPVGRSVGETVCL